MQQEMRCSPQVADSEMCNAESVGCCRSAESDSCDSRVHVRSSHAVASEKTSRELITTWQVNKGEAMEDGIPLCSHVRCQRGMDTSTKLTYCRLQL
jgi:hypothetical protein